MIRITTAILLMILLTPLAHAKVNCKKNPLYCTMKSLNPSLKPKWGFQLSNYIHKYSQIYKIDPYISIAIAMQESGIKDINRYESVLIKDDFGKYVKIKGITDIGVWQFHVNTIENFDIDLESVINDLDYATKQHFKLLSRKIKRCGHLGDEAWSCYHSATKEHREVYVRLVKRFYRGPKNVK